MNNYIITANNSQKWHVTEKLNFKFYFNYFKFNFKHWYLIQLLENLHMFGTIWMLFSLFFSIVHLWTVHIDQYFWWIFCLHIGRCWKCEMHTRFQKLSTKEWMWNILLMAFFKNFMKGWIHIWDYIGLSKIHTNFMCFFLFLLMQKLKF